MAVPVAQRVKSKENKTKQKNNRKEVKHCQSTKNLWKNESDGDTNYNLSSRNGPQIVGKRIGRVENQTELRLSELKHH